MNNMEKKNAEKKPVEKKSAEMTFGYSLITIVICLICPIVAGAVFGLPLGSVFLLAWILAFGLCMRCGFTYQVLEDAMYKFMAKSLLVVVFMIIIGGMSGAWNASGTIATVTYYGLGIFSPKFYSLTAFLICLIFALVTGTSWGTCGTIGVALVGIGIGLGFDTVTAAAPIFTAAFFGDMCSPLSDVPNVVAAACGINVIDHCKYQMRIAIPGAIILSIIYLVQNISSPGASSVEEIEVLREAIANTYNVGILPVLPLLIVVVLLAVKVPTIPTILLGTIVGLLIGCTYQGIPLMDFMTSIWSGNVLNTEYELVNELFSRGGMTSMSETILLVVAIFGLFGVMTQAGVFTAFLAPLTKKVDGEIATSFFSMGVALLLTTGGVVTVSAITTGEIMGDIFRKKGYNIYNLGMILSVCSAMFSTVMPWHANAMVPAENLGTTLAELFPQMYMPWVFLILLIIWIVFSTKKKGTKAVNEKK